MAAFCSPKSACCVCCSHTPITYAPLGVAGYNTLGCCVQQPHGLDCDICLLCLATEQVCVGLEEAIQTMKLSEVAEVIVQPQYGFGSDPHQAPQATVPPNSTLCYTVELVELHKVRFCTSLCSTKQFDHLCLGQCFDGLP